MSFLYVCVVLIIFNKLLFKPKGTTANVYDGNYDYSAHYPIHKIPRAISVGINIYWHTFYYSASYSIDFSTRNELLFVLFSYNNCKTAHNTCGNHETPASRIGKYGMAKSVNNIFHICQKNSGDEKGGLQTQMWTNNGNSNNIRTIRFCLFVSKTLLITLFFTYLM